MSIVQGSVAAEERLRWLAEQLRHEGSVTINDAAQALEVSEMTIRRDLAELEDRGHARRVRGGATAVGPLPFARRREAAARAKGKIAAKLVRLLPATGAIACDASSTVMRLASGIQHARDLTVITNGPDTFAALQRRAGVAALSSGGWLDPRTGSLVGPIACRAFEHFVVDTFFASAAAVSLQSGGLEATVDEAEVKRTIATRARRVVLAADASKLAGSAMAVALDWQLVDLLVTDLALTDRRLDGYRDLVEVL